jgi:hypothetical protein
MNEEVSGPDAGDAPPSGEKVALNKRLESISWGLFLIMIGGSALVPGDVVPKGTWAIGVGVIMLGLNAARYYYKIRMSWFTTIVGLIAVTGGIGELAGLDDLDMGFLLIVLGAYIILKPWVERRGLFGKAEDS